MGDAFHNKDRNSVECQRNGVQAMCSGQILPPAKAQAAISDEVGLANLQYGLLKTVVDFQGAGVGLEITLSGDQIHQLLSHVNV